ncbi:WD domain repeat-containing protein 55 [Phlyctochytrium planicorne]|nr:WD domain repeat-containing protein 55 [Phlyctochytrium planicorne]
MSAEVTNIPDILNFEDHVYDFAFHPSNDLFATSLINGKVFVYVQKDPEENAFIVEKHTEACRAVEFGEDGALFSAGSDRALVLTDSSTGKMKLRKPDAHSISPGIVASGDDSGIVKLWDVRQKKEVRKYDNGCTDFISDLALAKDGKTLLATCGDGTLNVYDITKKKPVKASDNQDQELLSVTFVRDCKKAVVGTEEGTLLFFNFGNWGDCTDRFPGHPSSIDAICRIDDHTIATGAGDGLIRMIGVFPNRLVRVLGDHGESGIERLRLGPSGDVIASSAHDNTVRFWGTEEVDEKATGDDFADSREEEKEEGGEGEEGNWNSDADTDNERDSDAEPSATGETSSKPVKRPPSSKADSSSDEDEKEDKERRKKTRKKAKRGIGGVKKTTFFADMD